MTELEIITQFVKTPTQENFDIILSHEPREARGRLLLGLMIFEPELLITWIKELKPAMYYLYSSDMGDEDVLDQIILVASIKRIHSILVAAIQRRKELEETVH